MTRYEYFALAAILLTTARYGIYFHTISQGKTKPHAFSWLIWGTISGIGTLAQFELNAGPSAWVLAFISATCFFIALLAIFIGERSYTKSDWIALAAALLAIPIWKITQNPVSATLIVTFIDIVIYCPTIRKSYNKPQTEPPISFALAGIRYFLMILAIPDPIWQNLIYPFCLMCIDSGFATYIVIRRAQLGYPLHEYVKTKNTD